MLEIRKCSEYNLVPPTPPCGNCRRERVYWDCYRDCSKWLDYALEYQAFVRRRDRIKKEKLIESREDRD